MGTLFLDLGDFLLTQEEGKGKEEGGGGGGGGGGGNQGEWS